jgi:RNA polymerase sigma-70 factor (sigma-E family)
VTIPESLSHATQASVTERAVGRHSRGGGMAEATAGYLPEDADELIAGLYRGHELALVRMALLLVGDRPTAEDVVQDAFVGLYRAAHRLSDPDKMLAYVRVSVVNRCRSVHRARRTMFGRRGQHEPEVWSAEAAALAREDSRLTLQAVARLPRRSREVLALRYYLDMTDREIATVLHISRGTVSSTASRALAVLARELKEEL